MAWNDPPDFWTALTTLIISTVSGAIAIMRRVISGHQASILWVISEYMTAILCGYLMFYTFPLIQPVLPQWVSHTVAIAFAAHSGGDIFKQVEKHIVRKLSTTTLK